MGYQLYWVRLCGVAAGGTVGVRPNAQSADMPAASFDMLAAVAARSAVINGTVPLHVINFLLGELPSVVSMAGATPSIWAVVGQTPVPARSVGSCSSRIAFGVIGLVPGAVGGVKPRANPSPSHSVVIGCQTPDASLYSTRR